MCSCGVGVWRARPTLDFGMLTLLLPCWLQHILDESVLGDSYMGSPEYEGRAAPASHLGQRADHGQATPAEAAAPGLECEGGMQSARQPVPVLDGHNHDDRSSTSSAAKSHACSSRQASAAAAESPAAVQPPSYEELFGEEVALPLRCTATAATGHDLLGVDDGTTFGVPSGSHHAMPSSPTDDLLGLRSASQAAKAPPASKGAPLASNGVDIDAVFSSAANPALKEKTAASGLGSMIDLGTELSSADTAAFPELYDAVEVHLNGLVQARAVGYWHMTLLQCPICPCVFC